MVASSSHPCVTPCAHAAIRAFASTEQHLTSDDLRAINKACTFNDEHAAFTQFLDDGGTVLADAAQENGHVHRAGHVVDRLAGLGMGDLAGSMAG